MVSYKFVGEYVIITLYYSSRNISNNIYIYVFLNSMHAYLYIYIFRNTFVGSEYVKIPVLLNLWVILLLFVN